MAMYLEHFGLDRAPFAMHPDPDFLYLSEQHSAAKAFLETSAFVNDSFVVITGSIGAGKTTLVEGYLAEMSPHDAFIARINQTQLTATGFLRMLLDELGLDGFKAKKPQLLARLRKFLAKASRDGRRVVVVVDEAQNLTREVLEEIRMLTGSGHADVLSVVLIGQPEFLDTLESPRLKQLAQRCRLRSHLKALEADETLAYISHRISIAGGNGDDLFTAEALDGIHAHTGGVPRLINSLCDTALLCAFADGLDTVGATEVSVAIKELKWPGDAAKAPMTPAAKTGKQKRTRSAKTSRSSKTHTNELRKRDQRIKKLESQLADATKAADALATVEAELAQLRSAAEQGPGPEAELAASHERLDALQAQVDEFIGAGGLGVLANDIESDMAKLAEQFAVIEAQLEEADALLAGFDQAPASSPEDKAALAAMQVRLEELEEVARSKDEALANLQNELDLMTQGSGELQKLEETLASRADAIEGLTATCDQLRNDLASAGAERDDAIKQMHRLEEKHEEYVERVEKLTKKTSSRDNSIRTLEAEVRRKNRLIDELHDKLEALPGLEQQAATLGKENAALSHEVESRNLRVFELQEALSLSQQRLDDTRRELDSSHTDHVSLHQEIGELKAQAADLHDGTAQRNDLLKSLQTECQNRKLDLRKLRRELDEALDQSRELRDLVEVGEARARGLEAELAAAMETIREMSESGSQISSDARVFERELAEREEQLEALQEKLRAKNEEIGTLETSLREKTETIKVLQMDVDASGERSPLNGADQNHAGDSPLVIQLRAEVEARGRRIDELEAALQVTAESLASTAEKADQQSHAIQQLEEQLESSRMAASELREELGQADREFDQTAVLDDENLEDTSKSARTLAVEAGLLVSVGGKPTRRVHLRSERLIIGRTRDSDIKIDNEFASRHHAQIVYRKGSFVLEDLNSTNGIFVNSRRVKRRRLRNRDVISIGPDKMVFVLEQHTSH